MTFGFAETKIYNLWPNTNQYRIVVAPNTDTGNFVGIGNRTFVYFFNSDGSLLAKPSVAMGSVGTCWIFRGLWLGTSIT